MLGPCKQLTKMKMMNFTSFLQVATALLVAGTTLTVWIPWQTSFASTSSYSSVVQSARLLEIIG